MIDLTKGHKDVIDLTKEYIFNIENIENENAELKAANIKKEEERRKKKRKGTPMRRLRSWCATINNPTEAHFNRMDIIAKGELGIPLRCFLAALEYGDKEKTPHLQIYISFKYDVTMLQVQEALDADNCHCEGAIGTKHDSYEYIINGAGGDKPLPERKWVYKYTPRQGKRQDIDDVRSMVNEGRDLRYVWQHCAGLQVRYA